MIAGVDLDGASGWSARSLVAGLLVGVLLCATTLFVGLKVGFTDSGNVTAAILAFALGRTLLRGRSPYSIHENQISHSLAACMGGAPIAVGLLTIFPGLSLLDIAWSPWLVALWGCALALVGIGLAFTWRRALLDRDHLRFPTGIATAELMQAMHASAVAGAVRARVLLGAAAIAATLAWLRDLPPRLLPAATTFGELRGQAFGIAWSPLLVGLGGLVGMPVAIAALAGSVLAWIGLAPTFAPGGDFGTVVAWTAWPATALLLASSLPSLVRAIRRLRHPAIPRARLGGLVVASALLLPLGAWVFDAAVWVIAIGLALVPFGALLCAHAAGEIDVSPHGVTGNLTLAGVGQVAPSTMAIGAGSAVAGISFQVPTSLWALRAGERTGTQLRSQLHAQVLGVIAGVAIAVPLYGALVAAHGGVGNETLPAAGAQSMRAFALLASEGGGVAASACWAAAIAFAVGSVLLAAPARRWISVAGLGVGMLIPIHYAAAIVLGAALGQLYRRWRGERLVEPAAAGLIVGESVVGVTAAIVGAVA